MAMPENVTPAYVKGQLYEVPLADLQASPDQPRKFMDPQSLEELTASIVQHGVLEPILFRQDGGSGILFVVAGERRSAAARKAGLESIPAIFIEGSHAEIALVENLLRQDLTPIEEAEALDRVMNEQSYKQEDLAKIIGKSVPSISEALSLNRLPQAVRDECRSDPSVPRYILVEIAKSKQQRGMSTLYNRYKTKKLSQADLKKQSRGKRKTSAEMTLSLVERLQGLIDKSDMAAWTVAEREELGAAIDELKQKVEEKRSLIAAVKAPRAALRTAKTKKKPA